MQTRERSSSFRMNKTENVEPKVRKLSSPSRFHFGSKKDKEVNSPKPTRFGNSCKSRLTGILTIFIFSAFFKIYLPPPLFICSVCLCASVCLSYFSTLSKSFHCRKDFDPTLTAKSVCCQVQGRACGWPTPATRHVIHQRRQLHRRDQQRGQHQNAENWPHPHQRPAADE